MPLQDHMQLISVDDHLIEHPRVWADRLPAKYQELGPHIVEVPRAKGGAPSQVWEYQGQAYPQIGLNAVAGKKPEEYGIDPSRFDEMLPGCYDPVQRLADMDLDGVEAALCFPSFPRFAGTVFLEGEDRDVALASVTAFNDFMLDEWCAAAPHRYIPVMLLPLWSTELCVAEIERCSARGARAISFPDNPAGPLGLPSFFTTHWDDVFRAATAARLPLCMHFGTSRITPATSADATSAVHTALFGITLYNSMCEVIFSSILDRHPELKIVYSEGGIGWLPYALQRIDQVWEKYRHYTFIEPPLDPHRRPSEVARDHIWGCFIDDPVGIRMRDEVGIDQLLWESDYPHVDSLWPNSRKNAETAFADVPDEEVARITSQNARALFHF
jgi:predicted TIM-barrel fold metal-dependent hydrolase